MVNVPSLIELCIAYLIQNLDMVESFDGVAPHLKEKLRVALMSGKNRQLTLDGMIKLVDSSSKILDFTGLRPGQMKVSHFVNLEEFKMTGSTELDDATISKIVMGFPKLKVIDLSRCPRITDQIFYFLSKSCPQLEIIRLSGCVSIAGYYFTAVKKCTKNKGLLLQNSNSNNNINNNNNINTNNNNNNNNSNNNNTNNNNNNVGESSSSGFWGLFKKGPMINNNTASGSSSNTASSSSSLTVHVNMDVDSEPLINLKELDIEGCKSLGRENMSNLCTAFPNLTSLNISKGFFGDEIAPIFLESFTPNITKLSLALNPISTQSLNALGRLVWLKDLSLHTCRGIPDSALSDLLPKLSNLEYLDISNCFQLAEYIFFPLTELPDPLLVLPKLKELSMSGCNKFSHFTLEHISACGCRNSLKVIKMVRVSAIFDLQFVMERVIPRMIALEKLDVRDNKKEAPEEWTKVVPRVTLIA